jgi:hypothetical protein
VDLLGLVTVEIGLDAAIEDGQAVILANCPTGPPRPF